MAAGFGIRAAGVGQVALRYYALFIAPGFFFFLFNYYYFLSAYRGVFMTSTVLLVFIIYL